MTASCCAEAPPLASSDSRSRDCIRSCNQLHVCIKYMTAAPGRRPSVRLLLFCRAVISQDDLHTATNSRQMTHCAVCTAAAFDCSSAQCEARTAAIASKRWGQKSHSSTHLSRLQGSLFSLQLRPVRGAGRRQLLLAVLCCRRRCVSGRHRIGLACRQLLSERCRLALPVHTKMVVRNRDPGLSSDYNISKPLHMQQPAWCGPKQLVDLVLTLQCCAGAVARSPT